MINPRVEEKIKDLPGANRERIRKLLDALQENPVPVDIVVNKAIVARAADPPSRVGRYRVIYAIYWDGKEIAVSKIELSKSVYRD